MLIVSKVGSSITMSYVTDILQTQLYWKVMVELVTDHRNMGHQLLPSIGSHCISAQSRR